MKNIADTGLLKAALDKGDPFHAWGAREFMAHAPFITCEAVLVELAYLLENHILPVTLLERGDVTLDFSLSENSPEVLDLLTRYKSRMSLADACLVRMSELHRLCKVWTVDKRDFSIYRRNRRESIPCVFPVR